MNYEQIILNLLGRVAQLEKQVAELTNVETETTKPHRTTKKYRHLTSYLKQSNQSTVKLTFTELENIVQFKLGKSAKKHKEFWANSTSHSSAIGWLNAGYKTVEVNLEQEYIVFEKIATN